MDPERSTITLPSTGTASTPSEQNLLIFFITGNPGIVEYYRTFLTLCYNALRDTLSIATDSANTKISLHIHSTDLAGFGSTSGHETKGPFDLEQQIEHIEHALSAAHSKVSQFSKSQQPVRVILVGHSVGSYILLEVLRRRQQSHTSPTDMRFIGGICLFPTVMDLAKSSNGKMFGYLFLIPHFPVLVALLAKIFVSWWPVEMLQRLVSFVNGMPADAARVTASLLKAPRAVRQALYLAKHEMATITTDKWDDELWGVVSDGAQSKQRIKLFFLFGKEDHWVADETREGLIEARASRQEIGGDDKPVMEVDQGNVPHAFCIKHNEAVARKVTEYVQRIVSDTW